MKGLITWIIIILISFTLVGCGKVYNTEFEDLKFEYEVSSMVYADGTSE